MQKMDNERRGRHWDRFQSRKRKELVSLLIILTEKSNNTDKTVSKQASRVTIINTLIIVIVIVVIQRYTRYRHEILSKKVVAQILS